MLCVVGCCRLFVSEVCRSVVVVFLVVDCWLLLLDGGRDWCLFFGV